MDFYVDARQLRECPNCHKKSMGRLVDDQFGDRTLFGLPMVIVRDLARGGSIDTRVSLDVVAYACQECAHLNFALIRPPASLQEAGKA